jgi:hypothetical protein
MIRINDACGIEVSWVNMTDKASNEKHESDDRENE